MSEWTLQGFGVLSATLVVRAVGAWVLDVELDDDVALTGPVELAVGAATWRGTVDPRRAGVFEGRFSGRVVGGVGGLVLVLPSRLYRSVPARTVALGACTEAGEILRADAEGLAVSLPVWVRRRETLAAALSRLTGAIGRTWRVTPEGEVTTTPWPTVAAPATAERLDASPHDRTARFATDAVELLPGMTLDGQTIEAVTYTLEGAALRAEVAFAG